VNWKKHRKNAMKKRQMPTIPNKKITPKLHAEHSVNHDRSKRYNTMGFTKCRKERIQYTKCFTGRSYIRHREWDAQSIARPREGQKGRDVYRIHQQVYL